MPHLPLLLLLQQYKLLFTICIKWYDTMYVNVYVFFKWNWKRLFYFVLVSLECLWISSTRNVNLKTTFHKLFPFFIRYVIFLHLGFSTPSVWDAHDHVNLESSWRDLPYSIQGPYSMVCGIFWPKFIDEILEDSGEDAICQRKGTLKPRWFLTFFLLFVSWNHSEMIYFSK